MRSITGRWPILAHWKFFLLIAIPIALSPLIFIEDEMDVNGQRITTTKFRCAYVILLMAIYWMLELLPLAITSLLPVVLLPLLGVESTSNVSIAYMKETNMMFIGGIIIALAVEYCNLHKRIALWMILFIGSSPIRILLGVMLTAMFLSMWMSNTATTAMMIPIVMAILDVLNNTNDAFEHRVSVTRKVLDPTSELPSYTEFDDARRKIAEETVVDVPPKENQERRNRKLMYLFAVAYASNIGGTGVVIGTAPNLIAFELTKAIDISQDGRYVDLTFATWMAYNIPTTILNVLVAWMYLVVFFIGVPDCLAFWKPRKSEEALEEEETKILNVARLLRQKYKELGSMNFHETAVALLFFVVVMLWLLRDPRFIDGWGKLFPKVEVDDSTAAMCIVLLLFVIPRDPSFLWGKKTQGEGSLLDWKYTESKIPWGIVLLMGAGFAISNAAQTSHLSYWVGQQLNGLRNLPNESIVIVVMIMTAFITEVASNAACANVIVPILLSLSKRLKLHPLYLTFPATISCSFAFMLPVATPPNAIAYAAGGDDMRILDMVKAGAFLNFTCIAVLFLMHISYGNLLFDFDNYQYADAINSTILQNKYTV